MSAAISSSSSAFLLLVASSSPRRRRGRVGAVLRSYGYSGAELRLHWARRGTSRDGAAVVRAAAAPAGGEGEEAAAAGKSSSSKGVTLQGSKAKAVDSTSPPKPVTSAPKQSQSAANQNGTVGSSSASKSAAPLSELKAEPSAPAPVTKTETDASTKVEEAKPAVDDAKPVESLGIAEPVDAKADTAPATDAAASADDDSEDKEPGPMAGPNVMNIIMVASECAPFCKTGGLGDVVGALPKALARRGHRVMVVIPRYGEYADARDLGVRRRYRVAGQDSEVTYFHSYIDGVDFVFIEAPPFRHQRLVQFLSIEANIISFLPNSPKYNSNASCVELGTRRDPHLTPRPALNKRYWNISSPQACCYDSPNTFGNRASEKQMIYILFLITEITSRVPRPISFQHVIFCQNCIV